MSAIRVVKNALRTIVLKILRSILFRASIAVEDLAKTDVSRVLIIPKFNRFSNVLSATGMIEKLKNSHPDVRIDLVISSEFERLFAGSRYNRQVITIDYPFGWYGTRIRNFYHLLRRFRTAYDFVIVLNYEIHHIKQALLAQMVNSSYILGVKSTSEDDEYDFLYNLRIELSAIDRVLKGSSQPLLRCISASRLGQTVDLPSTPMLISMAIDFLSHRGIGPNEFVLGFQIDSLKNMVWPVERFVQVARYFSSNWSATIAVFRKRHDDLSQQFIDGLPFQPIDLVDSSVEFEAAFLNICNSLVCVDLEFMYLAASQGCPNVWLVDPSENESDKPEGDRFIAIPTLPTDAGLPHEGPVIKAVERLVKTYPKSELTASEFDITDRALDDYLDFGDIRESTEF